MFDSKQKVELVKFENAEQLKEKLDSLASYSIISVIPMKYSAAEMGDAKKLTTVIVIYK